MAPRWQIGRRYDSIFEITARAKNQAIFEHVRRMSWPDCFNALAGIRKAEIGSLDGDIIEEDGRIVLENLKTLSTLTVTAKQEIARKHAIYRAWRIFHTGLLLTRNFMPEPEIDLGSFAQLAGRMRDTPLLLAPFHVGPSVESAVAILSRLVPLALVVRAENVSRLRLGLAAARPALDLQLIPLGPLALVQCLQAVRNGRSVCVAPDMLVHPDVIPTTVTFFGAKIDVPSGTAALASALNSPLYPFVFRHSVNTYHYRLFEPVWFPADDTGRAEALQHLIKTMARELERQNPWEWYGWRYLHDQLALRDALLERRPA